MPNPGSNRGINLGIVVTGAPLAARTADLIAAATAAGWQTSLAITESARPWLDGVDLSDTGFRSRARPSDRGRTP